MVKEATLGPILCNQKREQAIEQQAVSLNPGWTAPALVVHALEEGIVQGCIKEK
jgi:hypothetical protein